MDPKVCRLITIKIPTKFKTLSYLLINYTLYLKIYDPDINPPILLTGYELAKYKAPDDLPFPLYPTSACLK